MPKKRREKKHRETAEELRHLSREEDRGHLRLLSIDMPRAVADELEANATQQGMTKEGLAAIVLMHFEQATPEERDEILRKGYSE